MKKIAVFVLIVAGFVSCQPEPDTIKLLDQFVVSTNYDPAINFSSYVTYAMPTDTIGFVSNRSTDTLLTHAQSTLVRPILQQVMLRASLPRELLTMHIDLAHERRSLRDMLARDLPGL